MDQPAPYWTAVPCSLLPRHRHRLGLLWGNAVGSAMGGYNTSMTLPRALRRVLMRFSNLATISLLLAASLAGQQSPAPCTVEGTVVNYASGEPLHRVNLQLYSTRSDQARPYASVSTAEGRFEFVGVEPGRYMLRAERQGFNRH